jgi:cysteinyl-tRNA synthetase
VLGLFAVTAAQWFRLARPAAAALPAQTGAAAAGGAAAAATAISDEEVERRIEQRAAARRAKNWAESDRIRDELAGVGIILEDKPGGATTWRRA